MRNYIFAILIGTFTAVQSPAQADDLAGEWRGTWIKDGDPLPVSVTIVKTNNIYAGTFDSDALQVSGIPLDEVNETNGKVHFEIRGDRSSSKFDGVIAQSAISGSFTEGTSEGTFTLARAIFPATQVHARNVTFKDKEVTLAGTLLLPPNPGKHAAILFLQGSGAEGRWANHYLAQKCADAGIAALIYDKRGVGQSTGDWQKVGFAELADDAAAGIRFLFSQPEVDPAHIGIYGHSQGGTIAPLVVARAKSLRFVIASAAGGIDPADVETYSVRNSIGTSRLSPEERADAQAYIDELIEVAYRGKARASLDEMAAKFKTRTWYFDPPPVNNSYWLISKQIARFQPSEYWRLVKIPVLLIYGAHDERVPPRESASAIQTALKLAGNKHVTLKTYLDADHTFTIIDPPLKGGWPKHEPDYANVLVSWILSLP